MSRRDREQKANNYLRRATNYSVEAVPYLQQNITAHRRSGGPHGGHDADLVSTIEANLGKAVRFILPAGGVLFDDTKVWMLQKIRPPFDVCVFEFDMPQETWFVNKNGKSPFRQSSDTEEWVDKAILLSVKTGHSTTLYPMHHTARGWENGAFFPVIDDEETEVFPLDEVPDEIHVTSRQDLYADCPAPPPKDKKFVVKGLGFKTIISTVSKLGLRTEEEAMMRGLMNTERLFFIFAQACAALECTNVGTEVLRPNREALKARAPLDSYEYHILTIEPNEERTPSQERGGTHASPRTHLRRGHIRHLSSGKKVWVNSCLVNPGHGMIEKDYVLA